MNELARWVCAAVALWLVACTGLVRAEKPAAPGEKQAPAATPESAKPDPAAVAAARKAYAETVEKARQMNEATDGLALWKKFLADHPDGPMTALAQKEAAAWQDRVVRKLARFGPQWLPKADVDQRNAKADELVAQAEAAEDTNKAVKLLDAAARAHPFRLDIPFRKFELLRKANREREAGAALSGVIRVDPNNTAALNNQGVLAARQKQWGAAIGVLLRAADGCEKDAVWDNVDQVIAMARAGKHRAAAVAAAEAKVRGLVARLQKAGKHVGETRWGNSWITKEEFDSLVKEDRNALRKIAANKAKLRQLGSRHKSLKRRLGRLERTSADARSDQRKAQISKLAKEIKDIESAGEKLKSENESLASGRPKPEHAGSLVLLNLDGSELESLEPTPAGEDKDDKDKPKNGGGLFG